MSSPDLERLLREARSTLPDPDRGLTERTRSRIVAAAGRRRRGIRTALLLIALTVAATAVGFGFGRQQQVQAAQPGGVFGAGFLPAEGWNTFQRGRRDGAAAVASNVPLQPEDVVSDSVLPLVTLRALPRHGTVIAAVLEPRGGTAADADPLRLLDAKAEWQTIGGRTLLVRRLRTRVAAYALDVAVYFGARAPSAGVVAQAQRELERLVVEAPKVTIRVERRQRAFPKWVQHWVDISGTIASSASGEVVEVEAKSCGPRGGNFFHVIGGSRSVAGGAWKLETFREGNPIGGIPVNAYFRAQWDGTYSEPELIKVPMWANPVFNRRTRVVRAFVSTRETGLNVRGRFVELQRKVPNTDQWVRVRRAKLVQARAPFSPDLKEARFKVPTRGLTMRIFVPEETGAPCYSASVSKPFKS